MAEERSDYELYVEKFAKDKGITPEEATEHAIVKHTREYYEEERRNGEKRL